MIRVYGSSFHSDDPASDAQAYYDYYERLERERKEELAEEEYIDQQVDEQILEELIENEEE